MLFRNNINTFLPKQIRLRDLKNAFLDNQRPIMIVTIVALLVAVIALASSRGTAASSNNNTGDVCTTLECVTIAAQIASYMNTSADPCTDFYNYVCSSWVANNPIPSDLAQLSQFGILVS